MVLHVRFTNSGTISEALQSFLQQKQLYLRKLIGQRYDGAAIAGKISGVHKRIQTSYAYAIYIHSSCYRLQLPSIQEAASVEENHDQHFEVVFIIHLQKAEALKASRLFLVFPS